MSPASSEPSCPSVRDEAGLASPISERPRVCEEDGGGEGVAERPTVCDEAMELDDEGESVERPMVWEDACFGGDCAAVRGMVGVV